MTFCICLVLNLINKMINVICNKNNVSIRLSHVDKKGAVGDSLTCGQGRAVSQFLCDIKGSLYHYYERGVSKSITDNKYENSNQANQ